MEKVIELRVEWRNVPPTEILVQSGGFCDYLSWLTPRIGVMDTYGAEGGGTAQYL